MSSTPIPSSADRLAAHVARIVAEAPPLSHEQRETIAALLISPSRPQESHADLGLSEDVDLVGGDVA